MDTENTLVPPPQMGDFLDASGNAAVILLHGFMGTPYEMSFLGKALNEQGYAVYMPLIQGFGGNTELANKSTRELWNESLRSCIEHAETKFSAITLLGFSLGGTIVSKYIVDEDSRIDAISSVVLIAPFFKEKIPAASILANFLSLMVPAISVKTLLHLSGNDALVPIIMHQEKYNSELPLHAVKEVLRLARHLSENSVIRDIPVLHIFSDADSVVDNAASSEFIKKHFTQHQELRIPSNVHALHQIILPEFNSDFDKTKNEIIGFVQNAMTPACCGT